MKVTFIENGVEVEFEGQPMKKITLIDKEGWTEYDYAVAVITCVNIELQKMKEFIENIEGFLPPEYKQQAIELLNQSNLRDKP